MLHLPSNILQSYTSNVPIQSNYKGIIYKGIIIPGYTLPVFIHSINIYKCITPGYTPLVYIHTVYHSEDEYLNG